MAALAKVIGSVDVQRLTDGTTMVKQYMSAKQDSSSSCASCRQCSLIYWYQRGAICQDKGWLALGGHELLELITS